MSATGRGFHYVIDTELGVIHAGSNHLGHVSCPGLKFPIKYKYTETFSVYDTRDAERLDEKNLRPCHRCYKRLVFLASKRGGKPPIPGFVKEPPK